MSDRWVLAHDPREGEEPDEADICPHGELRERCEDCRREQQDDDEEVGVALAARFDTEHQS